MRTRLQLRSVLAVRPVAVEPLAPIVVEEPAAVPLWAVLPDADVSVDGVALAPVEAPAPVLGVAAVEPVLGVAAVEPLVVESVVPLPPAAGALPPLPDVVPDDVWAQARPNVPARAAAMTVMPNFLCIDFIRTPLCDQVEKIAIRQPAKRRSRGSLRG
jgi:hypothetical protein